MGNTNTTNTDSSSLTASPMRLRDGSWGVKVQTESVEDMDVVIVTTKAGKMWVSRIIRVLWRGKGIAICRAERLYGAEEQHHICSLTMEAAWAK